MPSHSRHVGTNNFSGRSKGGPFSRARKGCVRLQAKKKYTTSKGVRNNDCHLFRMRVQVSVQLSKFFEGRTAVLTDELGGFHAATQSLLVSVETCLPLNLFTAVQLRGARFVSAGAKEG